MELKVLEEKKNKLIFELKGAEHTLCNPLKKEIYNDKHAKISTYNIQHPLISSPQIIVETDGEESPKNVILGAIQRLKKNNERVRKEIDKEIK